MFYKILTMSYVLTLSLHSFAGMSLSTECDESGQGRGKFPALHKEKARDSLLAGSIGTAMFGVIAYNPDEPAQKNLKAPNSQDLLKKTR